MKSFRSTYKQDRRKFKKRFSRQQSNTKELRQLTTTTTIITTTPTTCLMILPKEFTNQTSKRTKTQQQ